MGDSQPPSADVDLVGSYALLRGGDVEIVLADPRGPVAQATALVLSHGRTSVTAAAEPAERAGASAVVARTPRGGLGNGIWSIRLGTTDSAPRLAARLLVQGERPLVLLWGADNPPTHVPPSRPRSARKRRAAVAGRAVDRVLSRLPEQRATQARTAIRSAARRVLG